MAVFQEEFIRCECGCADFVETKIVTVHKKVRVRPYKNVPLEALDTEYKYFCKDCDKELLR